MSDELKPCPFCGNQSIEMADRETNSGVWFRYPVCYFCGVSCEYAKRWNTRPLEDALRAELAAKDAEIARLKEEVATLEDQCANFYRYTQR